MSVMLQNYENFVKHFRKHYKAGFSHCDVCKEDYRNRECLRKCVELFMRENCDVCKKVFRSK
jgi:hypothetical protein